MKKSKILVFVTILFLIGVGSFSIPRSAQAAGKTGYIYTGDSRTRRLNVTIGMSKMSRNWVHCKSGMGYSWFVNDSLPKINQTMEDHPEIDNWVIVSAWGVNDLGNINTYLSKYKSLLYGPWSKCKLYLISVNPVNGGLQGRYSRITSFNSSLKQFVKENEEKSDGRVYYIDTYTEMMKTGYATFDGLHYTESTNKKIYGIIRNQLDTTNANMSESSLTMNVNSERQITLNEVSKEVKWSTSNRNVVRIVSTSGVQKQRMTMKAKMKGKATIRAKAGGITRSCKVKVVDEKVLVAYYSYSGSTERMAEYIVKQVGGDLIEIDPTLVYPTTYKRLRAQAQKELEEDVRPMLDTVIEDFSSYKTVYLGYPLWFERAPRAVCTFIESYDFNEKNVYPFITCSESDSTESVEELERLIPSAIINEELAILSNKVLTKKTKLEIQEWLY